MPVNVNTQLARLFADRGVSLLRLSAGEMRKLRALLRRLEADVVARLAVAELSASKASALNATLGDVRALIENGYSAIAAEHTQMLSGLITLESGFVAGTINRAIGIDVMSALQPTSLLRALLSDDTVLGAPSKDWWSQQATNLAFKFAQQMRIGIAQGETNAQLIQRVRGGGDFAGIMETSRNAAEALVRTSVQTVAHTARLETFKANDDVIEGVQQQSTLDNRTSDICIAYDGASWDLEGNPINGTTLPFNGGPPRHWNCRSVLVPIVKSWRDIGVDADIPEFEASTRASMDGEVAANTSFRDWFDSRSVSQQNEILGRGRAELYREGKITLQELLDQRGRPLTLQQLGGG